MASAPCGLAMSTAIERLLRLTKSKALNRAFGWPRVVSPASGSILTDGSVGGFTRDKFAAVREAFETNLANGTDVGASFCSTVEGETVVDLWGGWADEARTRAWEKDTIVNVYSTTKTMTALTALL